MNITVVGARGMAGHVIVRYLQQQGHQVTAVTRDQLNIENSQSVSEFFDSLDTDFLINCVGLLVQPCATRPDLAAMVNAWFPHYAEYRLQNTRTRLIHLSTDCVFDGQDGPYTELSPHTETNAYGRSKSFGEVNNNKDLTMRTSIIGPELKMGTGLLNWVTSNPASELPGWDNAWWNGITTLQMAKCIDQWIHNPTVTGVYHVVNNQVNINKYELLCLINQTYRLGKTVIRTQGSKTVNKILQDTRKEFDWGIPDYATQLTELRDWYYRTH
jgi:dTDP-4-dehydrorhamnose reductase